MHCVKNIDLIVLARFSRVARIAGIKTVGRWIDFQILSNISFPMARPRWQCHVAHVDGAHWISHD